MARKTKLTQREKIMQYLLKYGSITPLDALREFGCMRLATRIYELKAMGNDIVTEIETTTNKSGDKVHYARYILNNYGSDEQDY